MSKKFLLAAGCSYTDPKFFSPDDNLSDEKRGNWKIWADVVAEELNLKCLNVGESGNSNLMIYKSVLDAINKYENQIDTICVLWTGWDRTDLFFTEKIQSIHFFYNYGLGKERSSNLFKLDWVKECGIGKFLNRYLNSYRWSSYHFIEKCTEESLMLMQTLAEICNAKKIKYIFFQGVDPFDYHTMNQVQKERNKDLSEDLIYDSNALQSIRKCSSSKFLGKNKNIIGWPFIPTINGYHFDSLRLKRHNNSPHPLYPENGPDYKVSEKDWHPNEEGHKIIAKTFFEKYRELYGLYN